MDQLVSEGSLAAGLRLYADKDEFKKVEDNYKNHVYTFDGKSEYIANHAMTIVGYGILEDKVYWLIQNSLGPNQRYDGLIKIEIGQFREISFAQHLISSGSKSPVEIQVKLPSGKYQNYCNFIVESTSIHDWNNTIIVNFEHESKTQDFSFQIGKNKLNGKEEINCFNEIEILNNRRKGKYI